MAAGAYRTAGVAALTQPPAPAKFKVDRRARKVQAVRARQARGLKQLFWGLGFLIILPAGWLYPLVGYFIPLCMLLGIGLAAFKGRSWCDWLCPRGSFEDALVARISRGRWIPEALRRTTARLGVMAVLMGFLTFQIIRLWPDPWAIGGAFVLMLTLTTVVGAVLGVVYQQRAWCYVCPIGTISNWVGKNRRPLTLAAERCAECHLCAQNCPMQLTPATLKEQPAMAHRGDCLKCSLCVASCPTAALAFQEDRTSSTAA